MTTHIGGQDWDSWCQVEMQPHCERQLGHEGPHEHQTVTGEA